MRDWNGGNKIVGRIYSRTWFRALETVPFENAYRFVPGDDCAVKDRKKKMPDKPAHQNQDFTLRNINARAMAIPTL